MACRLLSLLALLLAPHAASAQWVPEGLNPQQSAAFQAVRLYIQGVSITPVNQYGGQLGPTQYTWQAYHGDRRITEAEFYESLGRTDLAASARARAGQARTLLVVGGALIAAGTAMVFAGLSSSDDEPEGPLGSDDEGGLGPLFYGGAVAGGVGAGMLGFSIPLGRRRSTHAQAASAMADEHNARLVEMLRAGPPTPETTDTAP